MGKIFYLAGDEALAFYELHDAIPHSSDFEGMKKLAQMTGWGFVVKREEREKNYPRLTILGWDVEILSYLMAKEQLPDDPKIRSCLEVCHQEGHNEVFLWDEKQYFLVPITGIGCPAEINFCRIAQP